MVKILEIPLLKPGTVGECFCDNGELECFGTENNGTGGTGENTPEASGIPITKGFRKTTVPPPGVQFALKQGVLAPWHNHPDNLPTRSVSAPKEPTSSGWGALALETLRDFEKDAARAGMFIYPFFVLVALRDDAGNRIAPSAPVLMIPNSGMPTIAGNRNFETDNMNLTVVAKVCKLRMRVDSPNIDAWDKLGITHMDVFVSEPLLYPGNDATAKGYGRESSTNFSHSENPEGICGETMVSDKTYDWLWKPESSTGEWSFGRIVKSGTFRHAASIRLSDLDAYSGFYDVAFNMGSLSAIGGMEEFRPDYGQLSEMTGDCATVVSGRTTVCGLTLETPPAGPLSSYIPLTSGMKTGGGVTAGIEVEGMKGNGRVTSLWLNPNDKKVEFDGSTLPRWLFFPDPDIRFLTVTTSDGSWRFPMQRHPLLYGSCFLRSAEGDSEVTFSPVKLGSVTLRDERSQYSMAGAIWRSEKGDYLCFPDNLLMETETGRVRALCRAFRASGLVATVAPTLYAFTDSGIYLLKEQPDGTLKDAGLIANIRLGTPDSLRMTGTAVEFVSDSGESMAIEGTKVKATSSSSSTVSSRRIVLRGPLELDIETRPLKMKGNCRIHSVAMAGNVSSGLCVALYGSHDLKSWQKSASGKGRIAGIWSRSYRFHKISIKGELKEGESLEGLLLTYS